jgi:glycine oxidase
MRGQMIAYRYSQVRNMVYGADGYLVPKVGGFLFAGATVEDVGFRPRTTERGLSWLRRMARSLVPALRYAEVSSAWAGLRPGSPDDKPILGPVPGWEGVTVATGHFRNGILLAPITGRLIAEYVLEGCLSEAMASFSPARFLERR